MSEYKDYTNTSFDEIKSLLPFKCERLLQAVSMAKKLVMKDLEESNSLLNDSSYDKDMLIVDIAMLEHNLYEYTELENILKRCLELID